MPKLSPKDVRYHAVISMVQETTMPQSDTDRIDLRLVPSDKDLIAQAAARQGLTLTAFIRSAAVRAAKEALAQD